MATVIPTSQSQFNSAVTTAANGDVVILSAGAAFDGISLSGRNNLTIKSADPLNPGTIRGRLSPTNCTNLKLEGINFQGEKVYTDFPSWNGLPIAGDSALYFDRCPGLWVTGCRFTFYRVGITQKSDFGGNDDGLTIEWSTFRQFSMDGIIVRRTMDGLMIQRNAFYDEQIHGGIYHDQNEHPDAMQFALDLNDNNTPAPGPHTNWTIQDNYVDALRWKGPYFGTGSSTRSDRFTNVSILRNWFRSGRFLVLAANDLDGALIEFNTVKGVTERAPGEESSEPALALGNSQHNITCRNNIIPRTIPTYNKTAVPRDVTGTAIFTNNVVKGPEDTSIAGPERLVPGVNCGAVVATETPPTQPTNPSTDGQFPTGVFETLPAGRFSRTLIIKTTSPAFAAGGPDNVQWRNPSAGITTERPMAWASQQFNSQGSMRLVPADGSVPNEASVGYATAQAGLQFRYRIAGQVTWSGWSPYESDGTLSPPAPPADAPDPLGPGDVLFEGLIETTPGRFTGIWSTINVPDPADMEWSISGGAAMPMFDVGVNSSARTKFRMGGSLGGATEHIVGFSPEEISNIRFRHYSDASPTASGWSIQTYSLAGPAAPSPPGGLARGGRLNVAGQPMLILGRPTIVGVLNAPAVQLGPALQLRDDPTSITIQVPAEEPAGAAFYQVAYGGESYRIRGGSITLVKRPGTGGAFTWAGVRGVAADGSGGIERIFPVTPLPTSLPTLSSSTLSPAAGGHGTMFTSAFEGSGHTHVARIWHRNGEVIPGETGPTYTSTLDDLGLIDCDVVLTNAAGSVTLRSDPAHVTLDVAALLAGADNALWLDPSDWSGVFIDAGSTPVSAGGQAVQQWADKSGVGSRIGTQATEASRPTMVVESDGRRAMSFDGGDELALSVNVTAGGVVIGTTASTGDTSQNHPTPLGASGGNYITVGGAASYRYRAPDSSTTSPVRASKAGPQVAAFNAYGSASVAGARKCYQDGKASSDDTGTKQLITDIDLLGRRSTSTRFNGRCYGVVARATPFTDAERHALQEWMGAKCWPVGAGEEYFAGGGYPFTVHVMEPA